MKLFLRLVAAAWCCCAATGLSAHSGKARFHLIVDTDGAADDLRTICMLLGNREAEVLAITTSEGALEPLPAARRAAALLAEFHHEGIPVGAGQDCRPRRGGRTANGSSGALPCPIRSGSPVHGN